MTTVIRPVTKLSAQQQELLDLAIAAAKRADTEEEAAWQRIKLARDAGVPDTLVCEQTGRSRATLNRRFGKRKDPVRSGGGGSADSATSIGDLPTG